MGTGARVVCFVTIFGLFGAILKFFHSQLVDKPPDVNEVRKEQLRKRKEGKKAQWIEVVNILTEFENQ